MTPLPPDTVYVPELTGDQVTWIPPTIGLSIMQVTLVHV